MQILRKTLMTIGLIGGYTVKSTITAGRYIKAGYIQGKE